jgi:hypothetical protein
MSAVARTKAKAAKINLSEAQAVNRISKVQTKAGNKAKGIVIRAGKASKTVAKADRTSKIATAAGNKNNRIAARVKVGSKGSKGRKASKASRASKTATKAAKETRAIVSSGERTACAYRAGSIHQSLKVYRDRQELWY